MKQTLLVALSVSLLGMPALASATPAHQDSNVKATTKKMTNGDTGDLKDAISDVKEATQVVRKMEAQPNVAKLLRRAKGVFLVPDYGRGAIGIGGSGGSGVLVARNHGRWSNPVFYNFGSVSVGPEAGVTAGHIAMILMTDDAVNSFKSNNTFSLNANAGLTIVNYSARGQASVGKGDVVLWSDTKGAFVGASLGGTSISADEGANRAYYSTAEARPTTILNGSVNVARPSATRLRSAIQTG